AGDRERVVRDHRAHEGGVADRDLAAVEGDTTGEEQHADGDHGNVRLRVLVHVQHPGEHDQSHGAAHGDRHEDAALAEPDVVELPRADEHHPVHDDHGREDHGG